MSHLKSVRLLLISLTMLPAILSADEVFSPYVDDKGNISFPENFRTSMAHLGSWFVPAGDASGFHGVYTEKRALKLFKKPVISQMVQPS